MTLATFKEYIESTRNILKKQHPTIEKNILDEIAPKEYIPDRNSPNRHKGILLIHGLLASATTMSSLYETYSKQGYEVKNILLPGHGTMPEDTLTVSYQQWIDCALLAFNSFSDHITDITIMGFSAGAIIGSYLAQTNPQISRLILFAPAFELAKKATSLIPTLQKFNEMAPWAAKQWLTYETEKEKHQYASITTNCVYQVLTLIDIVQKQNQTAPLHCPIFMIISTDDETVTYQGAIDFFEKQSHPNNHLLIYSNSHELSNLPPNTEILPSCFPQQKILNYSHIAMHVAPDHPFYGENSRDRKHYLGAFNTQNQSNYKNNLARLTFNPTYTVLIEKINAFMSQGAQA